MKELEFIFEKYIREITIIEFELLTVREALYTYRNKYKSDLQRRLIASTSIYKDIRIKSLDIKSSEHTPEISTVSLDGVINRIESRESLFALMQAYETFESYLKRILCVFLQQNSHLSSKLGRLENSFKASPTTTDFINQNQGKNNKKLLWMLRKLSKEYSNFEKRNSLKLDLSIWFDLTSDIRHLIVHNKFRCSSKFEDSLTKNGKQRLFNVAYEMVDSTLTTNREKIDNQIVILNSYAYLILESLKIES